MTPEQAIDMFLRGSLAPSKDTRRRMIDDFAKVVSEAEAWRAVRVAHEHRDVTALFVVIGTQIARLDGMKEKASGR